jgi:hypothetical protein
MNRGEVAFANMLESWLEVTETPEDPGAVLDRVVKHVDGLPQRRSWWPPSSLDTAGGLARFVAAGAAAVVLTLIVVSIVTNGLPTVGGPGPVLPTASSVPVASSAPDASASPDSSSSPTATPSPSSATSDDLRRDWGWGRLEPGVRFVVTDGDRGTGNAVYSFAVPATGWAGDQFVRINRWSAELPAVTLYVNHLRPPDNFYADPCTHRLLSPPVSQTAPELATAVADLPGIGILMGPTAATVGGYPAWVVHVAGPADPPCAEYDEFQALGEGMSFPITVGRGSAKVWVVDVNGELFWFYADVRPLATAGILEELDQVVDSIRFE